MKLRSAVKGASFGAIAVLFANSISAATLPAGFSEAAAAPGLLSNPTRFEFAPDGRIFVLEQTGAVRIIKNGALLATPFATFSVDSLGERGLLGIAFDPDFAVNQYVYFYYTVSTTPRHNRIVRVTANGDEMLSASEVLILRLDDLSTATNHNGGVIHFGKDGYLFAGVGENANSANSQTLNNLLGKVLRLGKDGTIPSDNPFFTTASGDNRAIWALGLRNPFTLAIQRNSGRILINDVGETSFEEIDDGIAGSNYGWPATEGYTMLPQFRSPLYAYAHGSTGDTGCAITGGDFYNPPVLQFPAAYLGMYFYTDLCSGWIRVLSLATNASNPFASGIDHPVDLKVGPDGALYYLSRGSGMVFRVASTSGPTPIASLRDTNGAIRTSTYASALLSSLGGVFASDAAEAETSSGDVMVAARDSSNAVWINWLNVTSHTWAGWIFGGGITGGVPAVAAAADGTVWIAARDSFGSYWLASYSVSGGYGTWTPLQGSFATDPAIASCADGSIYLAGKDSSNAMWSGRYIPGTGFQNWVFGGGAVSGSASLTCGSDNASYLVARDSSNSNWMVRIAGNTWGTWFNGGAQTTIDPRIAALGGSVAVVILGGGGSVWRNTFTEGVGNGWQAWAGVGGGFSDISPAGVNGELFFIAKALNNDLWWWRQTGSQFTWIGNNSVAAGALATAPR